MDLTKHLEEILSLNADDLDVEELERRLEMAPILLDGCTGYCGTHSCNCNCSTNCCGNCSANCQANCSSNCGTLYGCGRLECQRQPDSNLAKPPAQPDCI